MQKLLFIRILIAAIITRISISKFNLNYLRCLLFLLFYVSKLVKYLQNLSC